MIVNFSGHAFPSVGLRVLLVVFCLGTNTFAVAPPAGDSLTFQGKDVSYWSAYFKNEPWRPQFYWPTEFHPMWVTDPKALPVLMRLAADPDSTVQQSAIRLIGRYRERGGVATSILARALHSRNNRTRYYALMALNKIGPKASNARVDVEKLLSDPDQHVAEQAKETMRALRKE